jgi:23S rRNA (cytidine1920-2'-O)/16S rRNA (cytidine1409-2'-O)-methyltransferase
VVSLENFDARRLSPAEVPDPISAITVDVSFISVTKLLAPALQLAAPGAWMVVLVKPQFEVGRDNIGSGGIVRGEAARQGALESVRAWIESQPAWTVVGEMPSPILGGSGNSEFLLGALRND